MQDTDRDLSGIVARALADFAASGDPASLENAKARHLGKGGELSALQATLKAPHKNITCSDEQLNATTINGNLEVKDGHWCDLVRVTVTGDVHLHGSAGIRIAGSKIGHDLEADKTSGASDPMSSGANVICNTQVGHDLHIHNSDTGSPWRIGQCGPVTVGHDAHFDHNAGSGNTVSNTTVAHDLSCDKNHDVAGSNNSAGHKKDKQCAHL